MGEEAEVDHTKLQQHDWVIAYFNKKGDGDAPHPAEVTKEISLGRISSVKTDDDVHWVWYEPADTMDGDKQQYKRRRWFPLEKCNLLFVPAHFVEVRGRSNKVIYAKPLQALHADCVEWNERFPVEPTEDGGGGGGGGDADCCGVSSCGGDCGGQVGGSYDLHGFTEFCE